MNDFIYSMASMSNLDLKYRSELISFYDKKKNNQGIIEIKKEYGYFKAIK